ncbi:hypothetical protein GCM10023213_00920 [Prosthecobacter algae]|uniref:Uncharacterized protein n=1 Tax=Prosthecobacter algae TaxID=1144682 RepID=A0ABP9NVB6_9BACT
MRRYLAFSFIVLALAGAMTAMLNAYAAQTMPNSHQGKNSGRSTAPGGVGGHQSQLSAVPGNI